MLAVFDSIAGDGGGREVVGVYRRRVPLGVPLALDVRPEAAGLRFELRDERGSLVDGRVGPAVGAPAPAAGLAGGAHPLPVSHACFACGTQNEIGLRLALAFDAATVAGDYVPRPHFRTGAGAVAPAVLTTLLDETAFWLGALASGESGMTTEIRIGLHRPVPFGRRLHVSGRRGEVSPDPADPRYWRTLTAVHDESGALVASGRITFVAVRGAARRLASGMLAMNPPEVVRRVFPAYV